jgi:hypothetical protein
MQHIISIEMSDTNDETPLLSVVHHDISQVKVNMIEEIKIEETRVEETKIETKVEDVKIEVAVNNDEVCYICLEIDDKLVKACENVGCTAKVHKPCISRQVHVGLDHKCGVCKSDIVSENIEPLIIEEIVVDQKKRFLDAFLIVCSSIATIAVALGKNIMVWNPLWLPDICMVLPFIFIVSYHHRYDSHYFNNFFEVLRDSYFLRFVSFSLFNVIIIMAHLIGSKLWDAEFFTAVSSFWGLIFIYSIILLMVFSYILMWSGYRLYCSQNS